MNAKYTITLIAFLWCASGSKGEPPLSYLETPYQAVHENTYPQTGSAGFGFAGPSPFSSGYATPNIYLPKKPHHQPATYTVPVTKYNLQTSDFGIAAENSHEDDYHNEPAHYEFHYNIHDPYHGTQFGHKEYRENHVTKGQYIVLLPDGRRQIVDYVADSRGYRPTIRYEGGFGYS